MEEFIRLQSFVLRSLKEGFNTQEILTHKFTRQFMLEAHKFTKDMIGIKEVLTDGTLDGQRDLVLTYMSEDSSTRIEVTILTSRK